MKHRLQTIFDAALIAGIAAILLACAAGCFGAATPAQVHAQFDPLIAQYPAAAQQITAAENATLASLPIQTGIVGEPIYFVVGTVGQHPHMITAGGQTTQHGYEFDFGDPKGEYNQQVGWCAAHVYTQPGDYQTSDGIVRIDPDTRPVVNVQPTQDLASVVAAVKTPTILRLTKGNYGTSKTIHATVPGIVIDGQGSTLTAHAGAIFAADTVEFRNLIFTADAPAAAGATKGPNSAIHGIAGQHVTAIGCTFGAGKSLPGPNVPDLQYGVEDDPGTASTFLLDCTGNVLSAQFLWGGGNNTVVLGCSSAGSSQEMPVRFSDPAADGITFMGGSWSNASTHPLSSNVGKESLTFRMASHVSVRDLTVSDGGNFAGWLQLGEGNQPSAQRTCSHALIEGVTFAKGAYLQVNAYANDVAAVGNTFSSPSITQVNIRTAAPGVGPVYLAGNTYSLTPGKGAIGNLGGAKIVGQ